jgi:hypothetical protein
MKPIMAVTIVVLGASLPVFAQSPMPPPPYGDYQQPVQSLEQKWAEIQQNLRRNQYSRPAESRTVKKGLLAPSENDLLNSAAFLRTSNAGLVRLLPENAFDDKVYQTHKELRVLGGGAFYSFATHTHAHGYSSDLKLENNKLITGFGASHYGIFRSLGDVPLEDLTLNDPRVEFLAAYQAARSLETATSEAARFREGVQLDGAIYRSEAPISVNSTFLLRAIAYRYIQGSDVLVALRVVRKDDDGGVIIAWKILKQYKTPSMPRLSRIAGPQPRIHKWPIR